MHSYKTFIFLKPEAIEAGLVMPIMLRLKEAGLNILLFDLVRVTEERIVKHYEEVIRREGDVFRRRIIRCYTGKWILPVILTGSEPTIIEDVRALIGATDPAKAAPGTIRGDLATDEMERAIREDRPCENLIHASDNPASFAFESSLWLGGGTDILS